MRRLMLDANICIHAIKRNAPQVRRRLEATRPQDVAISSIVAAELWTGVTKSRERQHNEQALREFLAFVEVLGWPAEAARIYGEIRAGLEATGRSISAMDLLIAAHALHERATLVTRNRDEFRRIDGLKVESWEPHSRTKSGDFGDPSDDEATRKITSDDPTNAPKNGPGPVSKKG